MAVQPHIAFTIGDVNGIGPEVLLAALERDDVRARCSATIVGNLRLIGEWVHRLPAPGAAIVEGALRIGETTIPIIDLPSEALCRPGTPDPAAGKLAGDAIARAVAMVLAGDADALVTMPISKETFNAGGYAFPGHTEMLAALAGGRPLMILMTEGMRVALATIHIPLAAVAGAIDRALVEHRLQQLAASLTGDFGIVRPRIAVLGLNPHAGEHGRIGHEEEEIIVPAVANARAGGIDAAGPFPADGFFARYRAGQYDGILAMYHDQGLIPLKLFARGHGVNVTAGLPIVRTSPDHGTAFDRAGHGDADASSTIEAIAIAVEIVERRKFKMQNAK